MNAPALEYDTDAFDFAAVPAWFDRHPSQAEGEDD
ncbi:hypothetical protein J2S61_003230 [Microbacterium barkeri]|nr:hypothetical protein [Microbacterium barkeri]